MNWLAAEIRRRILPYGAWKWINERGEEVETLFNNRHQAMATRVNGIVVARLPVPPPNLNQGLIDPATDLNRAGVLEPPGNPQEGSYYLYGPYERPAWQGGQIAIELCRAAMEEWGLDYDALWQAAKWQIRQEGNANRQQWRRQWRRRR